MTAEQLAALRAQVRLRTSYQTQFDDSTYIVHMLAPKADLVLRGGLVEMTRANNPAGIRGTAPPGRIGAYPETRLR